MLILKNGNAITIGIEAINRVVSAGQDINIAIAATTQPVITAATQQGVASIATFEDVVTPTTTELVITATASDHITFVGAIEPTLTRDLLTIGCFNGGITLIRATDDGLNVSFI